MARYSKQKFNHDHERLSLLANAISHPARIEILSILSEKGSVTCGEIVNLLPFSQSTVSQHLNELKIAGIIKYESIGTKSVYSIDANGIDEYVFRFNTFFKNLLHLSK